MPKPNRLSLGGMELPIRIDAVDVLPPGGGTMQFDFTYRGIHFAAKCTEAEGTATIKLVGDVGPMPYTAEAPAARAGLSHIIVHANGLLGRVFRLAGERILVGGEATVEVPVNATGLLAVVARILIPMAPYLDLASVYFEPGGTRLKREWRVKSRPAGAQAALPPPSRPTA
jgi:hypothetical protein